MPAPDGSRPSRMPEEILAAYEGLEDARVEPLSGGAIHQTYAVDSDTARFVLQRVNPAFAAEIHDNIDAVTRHLAAKGFPTLRLVPTRSGALYVEDEDGLRWRLQTRLPGRVIESSPSPAQARSAGALLARFHAAVADFDAPLRPLGFVFHDTPRHFADLDRVLGEYGEHRLHAAVSALAQEIRERAARWRELGELPTPVIHGDPKFTNVLFAEPRRSDPKGARDDDEALYLIDFDTLARLPRWVDLGDAWRSWCNRRDEDAREAVLDLTIFRASAEGYLGEPGLQLTRGELESFGEAMERVCLELCARFAADALEEKHWEYDPSRFASRGDHNLEKARGQLSLYDAARDTREERLAFLLG